MKHSILIVFAFLFTASLHAQDCDVLVDALKGEYKGKCKKGVAHGEGVATGVDTYDGSFKKGLPDGEGTYTFANGNVYKGAFKQGKQNGRGVMTFSEEQVPTMDGYWMEGEFIGEDKNPYKVIDRSTSIKNVRFTRLNGDENKVSFKFSIQGKPIKSQNVVFECPAAVLDNSNDFETTFAINEFPIQGNVAFRAATSKAASGSADYSSGNAEIAITLKGKWEVTIEMNNF